MWCGLDSTELAKYSDLADKDKDRYSEEYILLNKFKEVY
jgi:hypothetical protein